MGNLLIRADAGTQTGSGHLMRCLALAQAWQDAGGQAIFALASGAEALLPRLASEGFETFLQGGEPGSDEDIRATLELAHKKDVSWLVLDGYCFGARYQKRVKEAIPSLLFVDDNGHAEHYCADVVLNQNLHASEGMYRNRDSHTRLLMGSRYALLRREFRKWPQHERDIAPIATRLLVSLGGADPRNVTAKVIEGLKDIELSFEARVVLGPVHPKRSTGSLTAPHGSRTITILRDNPDMPALMQWADMAIAAAGLTAWELCFAGVPSLLLAIAENQARTLDALEKCGAALRLFGQDASLCQAVEQLAKDPAGRREIARRARALVDGQGAARVVSVLRGAWLELRRVEEQDRHLLWEWANDPQARTSSFSTTPIPWEEHVAWFSRKMADPECLMFIGMDGCGTPLGQVRIDLLPDREAVMHVSIAAGERGCGLGQKLIREGISAARSLAVARCIHAYIKPENARSVYAFEKAGFLYRGTKQIGAGQALHYVSEHE
jgi:UDP-2,4-diacetamido-2,4,6-trideoxy-beta-L-altropyranose hydrolase